MTSYLTILSNINVTVATFPPTSTWVIFNHSSAPSRAHRGHIESYGVRVTLLPFVVLDEAGHCSRQTTSTWTSTRASPTTPPTPSVCPACVSSTVSSHAPVPHRRLPIPRSHRPRKQPPRAQCTAISCVRTGCRINNASLLVNTVPNCDWLCFST